MLLALDVGNTNVVLGLYEGTLRRTFWRLHTERERTADEYALLLRELLALEGLGLDVLEAVVIANVVPPTARPLDELCIRYLRGHPWVVGENLKPKMAIRYEPPTDVGADRVVDAYTAKKLYGTPVVVVDCGTATSFNAVSAKGEYLGGAIAPGIGISLDAMFRSAARLQPVNLVKPERVIGRSTRESIQAGVLFGYAGMIDGVVRRFREELGPQTRVVATGGLAELIAPETETVQEVNPFLTLDGLALVWHDTRSEN